MTDEQLRHHMALRDAVLAYFRHGDRSYLMDQDPLFVGYTNNEVRRMLHAVSHAALVWRWHSTGPGAIYQTTPSGLLLLRTEI